MRGCVYVCTRAWNAAWAQALFGHLHPPPERREDCEKHLWLQGQCPSEERSKAGGPQEPVKERVPWPPCCRKPRCAVSSGTQAVRPLGSPLAFPSAVPVPPRAREAMSFHAAGARIRRRAPRLAGGHDCPPHPLLRRLGKLPSLVSLPTG